MRKKSLLTVMLLALIVCLCCMSAAACAPAAEERVTAYVVRFNDNYTGESTKSEVEEGKTVTLPEEPTRAGYIFKGWYLGAEEDATEKFDETKPVTGNLTVYAKWEKDATKRLVTLKFFNFRTQDEILAVNSGSALTRPQDPAYDENGMYTFVNWYTDEALSQVYDFSSAVNSDFTLYAGWKQAKVKINLDANYAGAEKIPSVIVEIDQKTAEPQAPARNLYEFGGWYTERLGGEKFDFTKPVTESVSLYAHWVRSEYYLTFKLNGAAIADGVETSYTVKRGSSATETAKIVSDALTFNGHTFSGWYTVATDPDSEDALPADKLADLSSISDDVIVYAGWTLNEYTVTFDLNYTDALEAPASQTVKYGKLAEEPEKPERGDYLFVGWFMDEGMEEQFTFDMPVEGNLDLKAKWIENSQAGEEVTVTYYYDLGAGKQQYAVKKVAFGGSAAGNLPEDPKVEDYYFAGWYRDEQFSNKFNASSTLTQDTSLYGKMLKKYTFEAEAVDFTGKKGQGTSTNSNEEGMIMDYKYVKDGNTDNVSNGYFVREMYYNGAMLDFVVEAEEEVFDAVLYLRVSSESYEFFTQKEKDGKKYNYLSDEEFKIIVNGDWDGDTPVSGWLKYGGLYMPLPNLDNPNDLDFNKTPFEDCLIITNLHLLKGTNYITLYVDNNNNHGGTFHAEAPIIDCIYIYSSTKLTMTDYKFYERPGVQRG